MSRSCSAQSLKCQDEELDQVWKGSEWDGRGGKEQPHRQEGHWHCWLFHGTCCAQNRVRADGEGKDVPVQGFQGDGRHPDTPERRWALWEQTALSETLQ